MEQQSAVIEWVNPKTLKPHPKGVEVYGKDSYADLVPSIKELGVLQPLFVTSKGLIISGYRRWQAAIEAERQVPVIRKDYPDYLEEQRAIIELNRYRIKTGQQLYNEGKALKEIEAERAKQRQGSRTDLPNIKENFPESKQGQARDTVAQSIGLGSGKQWDKLEYIGEQNPDLLEKISTGGLSIDKAYKKVKKQTKEAEAQRVQESIKLHEAQEDTRFHLITGNFATEYKQLTPESVDAIVTDPPYSNEYLDLYNTLSKTGQYLLKEGGSLLILTGQSYLPEVLNQLSQHLNYHWIVAYLTPGGQSPQLWTKNVNSFWKPVLWFTKGNYTGNWTGDVVRSAINDNDKTHHQWGQSESGFADLLNRFTKEGDLVLDPLMGAGTTGAIAIRLNRQFIGIDISEEQVSIARGRIAKETNEPALSDTTNQ